MNFQNFRTFLERFDPIFQQLSETAAPAKRPLAPVTAITPAVALQAA